MEEPRDVSYFKKTKGIPYTLQLAVDLPQLPSNLRQAMRDAEDNHFDSVIVNIFKELNFRDEKTAQTRCIAQTLSGKYPHHRRPVITNFIFRQHDRLELLAAGHHSAPHVTVQLM